MVAAGVLLPAPARAASCGSADGVTVVVDLARSGGSGITTSCVADGGGDAASQLFVDAGHELTRVSSQPGAVCKVDGYRTQDACQQMPAGSAYWGLFWSDGDGGWVYSQEGVDNLNVPDGGWVAWAWQNGGSYDYPGVAPASNADSPSPSPSPSHPAGNNGSDRGAHGGRPATSPSASPSTADGPTASAVPSAKAGGGGAGRAGRGEDRPRPDSRDGAGKQHGEKAGDRQRSRAETSDDSAEPATGTEPVATSDPAAADGGLPAWVAPSVIGALFAAAGVAAWLRRRASASG